MKTLAIYFIEETETIVEVKFDDTIIKMYQAQKAIEDRILNAEDPEEEMAKIEVEAEAALADAEALRRNLNEIALIMRDRCQNKISLAELEALESTSFTEEIIEAKDVPDEIRRLADE
jgi:hypothetical protein